ncbi:hypothetical protein BV20DRAFT_35580 [Pilatotrama ljubarskyi]|nr:hypothetical protein BV20DRAFT_35580 [Pilatotrama ljubarskyi]
MSHFLKIASPRPQKPAASYAKILTWQESDSLSLSSGTESAEQRYTYPKHPDAQSQHLSFALLHPWASHIPKDRPLDAQLLLTALLSRAPQCPPLPQNTFLPTRLTRGDKTVEEAERRAMPPIGTGRPTSTGEAVLDPGAESFVGRDGTRWPMPPMECRPYGACTRAAATPSSCSDISPRPSSPLCATTPESSTSEDEVNTPPPSSPLSLAELGRDWYASFGKELGARPIPVQVSALGRSRVMIAPSVLQHLGTANAGGDGILNPARLTKARGASASTAFFVGRDGSHWPLPPGDLVPWRVP